MADALWRYDYLDLAELSGVSIPRPIVPISLRVPFGADSGVAAAGLVGSGSEHTLADQWSVTIWGAARQLAVGPAS